MVATVCLRSWNVIWKPFISQKALKVARELGGVVGAAAGVGRAGDVRVAEGHPELGGDVAPVLLDGAQDVVEAPGERDRPAAALGLGLLLVRPAVVQTYGTVHGHLPLVDVRPAKPTYLASAHAGRERELDRQREMGGLGRLRDLEHARALGPVERVYLLPLDLGRLAVVAEVLVDEVECDRMVHRLAQQPEGLRDRARRVALLGHLRHPAADGRYGQLGEAVGAGVAADDLGLLSVVLGGGALDEHAALLVRDELVQELGERELGVVSVAAPLELQYQLVPRLLGLLAGRALHGVVGRDQPPESGSLWLSVTSHLSVPRRLFSPLLV